MVNHRDGSTAPAVAQPAAADLAKTTGGKGGNTRNLMLAGGRGRQCQQSAPSKRSKRVAEIAENAGIGGNEVLECMEWLRLANR
jgi:hypothetical protein